MPIDLTVSIVAYRNYNDILNALSSLEKWTNASINKRVFIIDNGCSVVHKSTVLNFVEQIDKYNDVVYIDAGQNLGFGKGHNYVINKLNSKYHAIVNPDIIFCEDAFSNIITWMDDNPEVGMVIPNIVDDHGIRQLVYREELTVLDVFIRFFLKGLFKKRMIMHTMQNYDYSKPFQVPFGQGSFLVIRTDLFKKLNGFDEKFFMYVEDADLCKRVNQVSKLMYFPKAKVIHKWQKGSHHNKTLFKYHLQSLVIYFKKWGVRLW